MIASDAPRSCMRFGRWARSFLQCNLRLVYAGRAGASGAVAYAEASHKTNTTPSTIFAIDTFVSSDSPLEPKRYADGILGDGFLVRAIDNSNIVPWKDVQQVRSIARSHQIRVQYGVTGGGNDGAAFQRYGTTDVALSWPLRNSFTRLWEVMDLGDLDSLSSIVVSIGERMEAVAVRFITALNLLHSRGP